MKLGAIVVKLLSYTVTDGDTLRVNDIGIRLWGIDAPEMSETGGSAAKRGLRQLTGRAQLTCNVKDTDRYGRIVAQCYLPDGRDVVCELIEAGHAEEWVKYSRGVYGRCTAQGTN